MSHYHSSTVSKGAHAYCPPEQWLFPKDLLERSPTYHPPVCIPGTGKNNCWFTNGPRNELGKAHAIIHGANKLAQPKESQIVAHQAHQTHLTCGLHCCVTTPQATAVFVTIVLYRRVQHDVHECYTVWTYLSQILPGPVLQSGIRLSSNIQPTVTELCTTFQ